MQASAQSLICAYVPSKFATKLDCVITMTRFRLDLILLHIPTGELERCRADFDTFGEAMTIPYELIRELQDDPDTQPLQSNSWADLNGLRDENGVEEVFGCYFRAGPFEEVHGLILATALHDRAELGG